MTDLRQAAQQALNCIKRLNKHGWILADHEDEVYSAIIALKAALKQQPGQEPTPWRDMVVVSLVREGINKHKARELADHFAAQPVQEPWGSCVSGRVFVGRLPEHVRKLTENDKLPIQLLYTAPPQRKPLTDEEIDALAERNGTVDLVTWWRQLARAIEAAHGIKEQP